MLRGIPNNKENQMLIKMLKQTMLGLALIASCSNLYAGDFGGGNGGDICENRIKIIRNDIESWILKGGAENLSLEVRLSSYVRGMLAAVDAAKISCPSSSIGIGKTEKTCKNFTDDKGIIRLQCNFLRFDTLNEEEEYRLIHHELAGIAGLEVNSGDNANYEESHYQISNQIAAYLEEEVIKRLAVKTNSKPIHDLKQKRSMLKSVLSFCTYEYISFQKFYDGTCIKNEVNSIKSKIIEGLKKKEAILITNRLNQGLHSCNIWKSGPADPYAGERNMKAKCYFRVVNSVMLILEK